MSSFDLTCFTGRNFYIQVMVDADAQMGSVTGLYENKPSVTAVFPLPGPEAVEP